MPTAAMGAASRCLLYATAFIVYAYSLKYFLDNVKGHALRKKSFGGEWKYLTHINLWLQTGYYAVCLLAELLNFGLKPSSPPARLSRSLVDWLHTCVAWPTGSFVVLSFWTLYSVDRDLIYPKILDTYVPQWLNHVLHTVHIPFLLAGKYVAYYKYPSPTVGMSIIISLALLYQIWVLYLAIYHEIWVYHVMAVLPWPFKILFFMLLWCALVLLYRTGRAMSDRFWGKLQKVDGSLVKAKIR